MSQGNILDPECGLHVEVEHRNPTLSLDLFPTSLNKYHRLVFMW